LRPGASLGTGSTPRFSAQHRLSRPASLLRRNDRRICHRGSSAGDQKSRSPAAVSTFGGGRRSRACSNLPKPATCRCDGHAERGFATHVRPDLWLERSAIDRIRSMHRRTATYSSAALNLPETSSSICDSRRQHTMSPSGSTPVVAGATLVGPLSALSGLKDRPHKRKGMARKRSSAKGVGCARCDRSGLSSERVCRPFDGRGAAVEHLAQPLRIVRNARRDLDVRQPGSSADL